MSGDRLDDGLVARQRCSPTPGALMHLPPDRGHPFGSDLDDTTQQGVVSGSGNHLVEAAIHRSKVRARGRSRHFVKDRGEVADVRRCGPLRRASGDRRLDRLAEIEDRSDFARCGFEEPEQARSETAAVRLLDDRSSSLFAGHESLEGQLVDRLPDRCPRHSEQHGELALARQPRPG